MHVMGASAHRPLDRAVGPSQDEPLHRALFHTINQTDTQSAEQPSEEIDETEMSISAVCSSTALWIGLLSALPPGAKTAVFPSLSVCWAVVAR